MFNRKAALLAVVMGGVLAGSGALIMLTDANGRAHGPTPPPIDTFDLMSKAGGLVDQKIEYPF